MNTEHDNLKEKEESEAEVKKSTDALEAYGRTAAMNPYGPQAYQPKKNQPLNAFQQQKVTEYLNLVKWVVNRIMDRLPKHIQSEDLSHSGILGLIDAVQRFQWGRENEKSEFKAYAECRIRGQIMDELRQQDILPRSTREKVNSFKRAMDDLRKKINAEPNDRQICDFLSIDLDTCHRLKAEAVGGMQISINQFESNVDALEGILRRALEMVNLHTPEGLVHVKEVKALLTTEIENLSVREKQVISLYYLEEMTLKEIGAILTITESRVSQIHSQALARLMVRLKKSFNLDGSIPEGI
ncbi:FliA/WhiG family RNA polymerase sigma factor [bacterium]|nr:FliA/WhiG family RNA polymerase sigma factor [bacterium]